MGTRCYLGRVPYKAVERDVENFFRGYGRINDIILKNGFAFVEFSEYRDADDAAHDLNGREMLGERVTVELARGTPHGRDANGWRPPREYRRFSPRDERGRGGATGGGRRPDRSDYRLLVENLSTRIGWQELKDFFRDCGEVCYADAHTRKEREGLVEFTHKADMMKALERMNGKELNGRKIELTEDKTTQKRRRSRSSSGSRSRSRSPGRRGRRSRSGSARKRSGSPGDDKSPARKRSRSASRSASPKDKSKEKSAKKDASPAHSDASSGGKKSPKPDDKSANGGAAKRDRSASADSDD